MLNKFKERYANMKPSQRHAATISMIVGGIVCFGVMAYTITGPSSKQEPVNLSAGPGKEALNLDNKILEKTLTARDDQQSKEVEELKKKVADLEGGKTPAGAPPQGVPVGAPVTGAPAGGSPAAGVQQLDNIIKQKAAQGFTQQQGVVQPNGVVAAAQPAQTAQPVQSTNHRQRKNRQNPPLPSLASTEGLQFTPPPPPASGATSNAPYYQQPPAGQSGQVAAVPAIVKLGKIGEAPNKPAETEKTAAGPGATADNAGKKKDEQRAVYLPPSFMEATLLSGLNAPTSDAGKGNPVPVIIRVAAPAILPNEVRANLKGCFVIGEAVGSLSDERAHTRLVSISCLSKKGQAVIDQEITGFVQDADGGIGLTGRVVSKMGAAVARLAAAGLMQGLGSAITQSTTSTTISPLGQVNAISNNLKDIGIAAAGGAIANSSKGLAKIYEDLTLGSLPVIEVGNGKKITLVVTKGVNLAIKSYKSVTWY